MKKIILATVIFLTACSSSIDPKTGLRSDPLEPFNRAMWNFNYKVADPYILKPVAKGWKNYVPQPIKTGIINVSHTINEPAAFINSLLQGEGKKAMIHFNRFWINAFFGLGGLIDVASMSDPLKIEEQPRFGNTLGKYGVPAGTYIMLPFYGPATLRQDVGNLADTTYPLLSTLGPWTILKGVVDGVDTRSSLLDKDILLEQSADPYITFREAYFQNLDFKDGKKPVEIKPDFNQSDLDSIDD